MIENPSHRFAEFCKDAVPVPLILALGLYGLGILGLCYDDFARPWQPIPQDIPGRQLLAYLSGAVLLLAGAGVLIKPIAARSALIVTIYLAVFWVLPQMLKAAAAPFSVGSVLGFFETLAAACGAWILASGATAPRRVEIARRLFGVSCIMFGISHFAYAEFTAGMIPAWLPGQLGLAYATGAGHALAGLAIALGIRARLAATLEALMMSSFVLLVHLPSLWASPPPDWAPSARIQLTALCWASVLAGSAWTVARSIRDPRQTSG
jgi:uncharacterized membrane protein